jgi:hypothetical protein
MNDFPAVTLLGFRVILGGGDGAEYTARACGRPTADGLWEGWLAFEPVGGGPALLTARETTQPNHADAVYWATGLTTVYLEGALVRALERQGLARPISHRTNVDARL